ncbi:putative large-conductance mechanosensitive channel, partial [Aureobasidium melanogenum]
MATSPSTPLLPTTDSSRKALSSTWNDFCDFALRDNVLEVAVGLILAAAFSTVVSSFVSDILLPPISLLPFLSRNLDERFATLKHGQNKTMGYNTVQQALEDGAVVMAYGTFLNKLFKFLGIGIALYAIVKAYIYCSHDEGIIKHEKKCQYCRKKISMKAKRCFNCTSWQDGREDRM